MPSTDIRDHWGLLPIRLITGFGFLSHGVAKLMRGPEGFGKLLQHIGAPVPVPTAWMVTLLEIFGGLAILAGAYIALVTIPLILTMLVAMATVHLPYGFSSVNTIGLSPAGPIFGPPGYEINLLYIGALLVLRFVGTGAVSVDVWRARRRHASPHPGS